MADFVCIGDLHLDKLTKYWPDANRMQLACVRKVIKQNLFEGRKYFILLGDIGEGIRDSTGNKVRLSEDAQVALLELFSELDGKAFVDVLLGNHDLAEQGSHSLQIFIAAQKAGFFKTIRFHEKPTVVKRGGTIVSILPFPHKVPPEHAQFAVGHYEVHGAVGDTGYKVSGDSHDFATPVIQGHLHTPQKVRNHHYPGTLYQLSFGEKLPKGFGLVRSTVEKFAYRWVQHEPPFELRNVRIEKPKDFNTLTANPRILQKIFVQDDVAIPKDLLGKYPNIVNAVQYGNEKELIALENAEIELESENAGFNHEEFLKPVLTTFGATKKQIARALSILKDHL